jgi:branched-chain amino acid transport system substrate-binding protein
MKAVKIVLALLVAGLAAAAASARPASERPIRIGILSDCTGAWGFVHDYTVAGAELPLLRRGARLAGTSPSEGIRGAQVAGHPVDLVFGCADGSTASALAEVRQLIEADHVDIVIGPVPGNEEIALQDYARLQAGTVFVDGSASSHLQHPAPNFFAFHTDAAQWVAGLGGYAYHVLGWRRVVTVTNDPTAAFAWGETAGFLAEFCSLGGNVAKRIWMAPGTVDFSGVLAQIPAGRIDGFFVATNGSAGIADALARTYPGLRGNLARKLLVGVADESNQLGARIRGMLWETRGGPATFRGGSYWREFRRTFPKLDPQFVGIFDLDYATAMEATLRALDRAHGDLSHGEHALRAALAGVRLVTPNGPARLDRQHQAIASNFLWKVRKADFSNPVLYRVVSGVERTFNGYLTSHDPPPSEQNPACKHGHPPPWAR